MKSYGLYAPGQTRVKTVSTALSSFPLDEPSRPPNQNSSDRDLETRLWATMRRGTNGEPSPSPGDVIGRLLRLLSEATDRCLAAELECLVAEYAASDLCFARVPHDVLVLREVRSGMALFTLRRDNATGPNGVAARVAVLAAVPDRASIWHDAIPQMFAELERKKRLPNTRISFLGTHELNVLYAGTEVSGTYILDVCTRSANGRGAWTPVLSSRRFAHRFSCTVRGGGDHCVGLAAAPTEFEREVLVWWPAAACSASWAPPPLCIGGIIASSGDHLAFLGELTTKEQDAPRLSAFRVLEREHAWNVTVLRVHRDRGLSVAAQSTVSLGAVPPPRPRFYHNAYRTPLTSTPGSRARCWIWPLSVCCAASSHRAYRRPR